MTETKHTSVFDLFGTDRTAEEEGKWIKFGTEIEIKIRRYKSRHTINMQRTLERPFEQMRRKGVLPQDIAEQVLHGMICKSIVVDWKGIYDREGNEIPFSPEAADALLTELTELRDNIVSTSMDMDNFRQNSDEDVGKN